MNTYTNTLPNLHLAESVTHCCPLIHPADWDQKIFKFDDKLFARVRTRNFLHIPLNIGKVMKETLEKIDAVDARSDDGLILSDESSPWHTDHYLAITHDVPGLAIDKISGNFVTKVFEGPYKNVRSWYEQIVDYVRTRGGVPVKTYFFYTECPRCAKTYGKNYVVGFERIA